MSTMLSEALAANAGHAADTGGEARLSMAIPVHVYGHDVRAGKRVEVPAATRAGKAA